MVSCLGLVHSLGFRVRDSGFGVKGYCLGFKV